MAESMNKPQEIGIMEDRFIRWPELKKIVPLCRDRIYRLEKSGDFPKRKQLGGRSVAWLQSEIKEWMITRQDVI